MKKRKFGVDSAECQQAQRHMDELFRALIENALDVITILDAEGVIRYESLSVERVLGYKPAELIGVNMVELLHPDDVPKTIAAVKAAASTGHLEFWQVRTRHKDGSWRMMEGIAKVLDTPFVTGIVVNSRDITERKRNELIQNAIYRITQATITGEGMDVLYQSIHSILAELIPAENFFIALYDPTNELISFPYFIDQYDQPPSAPIHIQGLTGYVIRAGRSLLATREILDQLIQQGEVEAMGKLGVDWLGVPLKVEGRIIGVIAVQTYTQGIHFKQEDVDLLEFVSTQTAQVIERKRLEEKIRSLSLTDELTKLYNRRGFTLMAEQEMKLAHRMKRAMLLFYGDVDNLKAINDTFGHDHGDLALQEVSAILKENFREADILARLGGDEFVVLALDASKESAETMVNRIQAALEARNRQGDVSFPLSLSLGVARYDPEAPCTLSELIAQADGLMYHQKQARKGKIVDRVSDG